MRIERAARDFYYTAGHEWIHFQGSVAIAGVTHAKLGPQKQLREVKFLSTAGLKKQGDIIAVIRSGNQRIDVHMPVDGKIFRLNDELTDGNNGLLLSQPESAGWLFRLIPSRPWDRDGLTLAVNR